MKHVWQLWAHARASMLRVVRTKLGPPSVYTRAVCADSVQHTAGFGSHLRTPKAATPHGVCPHLSMSNFNMRRCAQTGWSMWPSLAATCARPRPACPGSCAIRWTWRPRGLRQRRRCCSPLGSWQASWQGLCCGCGAGLLQRPRAAARQRNALSLQLLAMNERL